ncbi:MAG: ABC transporter permease subunit [Acholeplasmataceae bacterium]
MNNALFKQTIKDNYKLFLIVFSVMSLYAVIIVSMYDAQDMASWDELLKMFPESLINAMGFQVLDQSFVGYIAGYYYGFLMLLFPMIYLGSASMRILSKYVDNTSMALLLATPNKRNKISFTSAIFLLSSISLLIMMVAFVIYLCAVLMVGEVANLSRFILLNLNVIALFYLLSGIGFFFSAICNETKDALMYGTGIPIIFFVIDMLKNTNDKLDFFKYFSVYSLFDTSLIFSDSNLVHVNIFVLNVLAIGCYYFGIRLFEKRDLPI